MYVLNVCAWCPPQKTKEGVEFPKTGIIDGSEPPNGS